MRQLLVSEQVLIFKAIFQENRIQKGRARRIVSRIYNYSLFAIVAQLLKNIISLSLKLFVKPKICVSDL